MEKDYIKIYNDSFSLAETLAEKEIITKFIDFKERGRNSNKAGNVIVQEFGKEKSNCRVMDESFQSLFYLFRNRLDEFAEDYQMNIIPEILFPEFNKIINSDNFSFENYIKELAEFNARDSVHNTFSNNRSLYSLMFELNDFSEFSIIGCNGGNYSVLYEKYRKKKYGEPSAADVISLDFTDEIKKKEIKNFNIKNQQLLLNDDYYSSLTYHFINDKKTLFEDFKNVLLEDFDTHKSEIHFFCSNNQARELILSFKNKFKGKMNFTNVEISKKFISNLGSPLSQTNLSHSKNASKEITDEILGLLK
jgi:hypothetical protein